MKKIFLFTAISISAASFAQNIKIKKGQQISVTTTSSQNTEMMGMNMKSTSTAVNKLSVTDAADKNYDITNTLTKLVINSDMVMQQINFDSDKPEDRLSETGKVIGAEINKAQEFKLDKITGNATAKMTDPEADTDKNPLTKMMGMAGGGTGAAVISNAFFIIPPGKKAGDSWIDSSTVDGIRTVNTYTIESVVKNIVTINNTSLVTGNTSLEMQGNQMNVDMNTNSTGKIIADTNTSMVKSRTITANINSNVEVAGQSLPVTGTATSSSIFE